MDSVDMTGRREASRDLGIYAAENGLMVKLIEWIEWIEIYPAAGDSRMYEARHVVETDAGQPVMESDGRQARVKTAKGPVIVQYIES